MNMTWKAVRCPYCRESIVASSSAVFCRKCHTYQHAACWNENGRCAVFGCQMRDSFAAMLPQRRLLLLLPSIVLLPAIVNPWLAAILSFLILPAYLACFIETVYFGAHLVTGRTGGGVVNPAGRTFELVLFLVSLTAFILFLYSSLTT